MGVNVIDAVTNSDIAETWTLTRSVGSFKVGGWSNDSSQPIQFYGVVSVAGQRELSMVPEGDRAMGAMVFWSIAEMFITNVTGSQTSDIITWRGEQYRIRNVRHYPQRGYFRAVAVRMVGD